LCHRRARSSGAKGNLLLAAVGFADWDADVLRGIANAMADRAS